MKRHFPQKKATNLRLCMNPGKINIPSASLSTPADAAEAFIDIVAGTRRDGPIQENFIVLFLNAMNEPINLYRIEGTLDHAAVYPREVVARALQCGAASLIMLHNHPSGSPAFSSQDVDLTRRLVQALRVVDIRIHDHIVIVLVNKMLHYMSMQEQGMMPSPTL